MPQEYIHVNLTKKKKKKMSIQNQKLKVGSFSFECFVFFAYLFSKLSGSTFYKEISKFQ